MQGPATRFTLAVLLLIPALARAGAPVPDGSTATTLDQARNGVPVVDIAPPNAAGLSHNRFSRYDVDPQGLILNNAAGAAYQSRLGG